MFVSNQEDNAEYNWNLITNSYPYAKRISDVSGIYNAYSAACEVATTDAVIIIDGDNEIIPSNELSTYIPPTDFEKYVSIWMTTNRVNSLIYGHGGIKVFPRKAFANKKPTAVDVTSSIGLYLRLQYVIGSIHAFDTNPYNTWRTAFREAAKLTKSKNSAAKWWLQTWIKESVGPMGRYSQQGAMAGYTYASTSDNIDRVNDGPYLMKLFAETNQQND